VESTNFYATNFELGAIPPLSTDNAEVDEETRKMAGKMAFGRSMIEGGGIEMSSGNKGAWVYGRASNTCFGAHGLQSSCE
jgi:hypothetical protein